MMHKGIIATSFDEFIKRLNEFADNNDVKATQTHIIIIDNIPCYYAVIYYKEKDSSLNFGLEMIKETK